MSPGTEDGFVFKRRRQLLTPEMIGPKPHRWRAYTPSIGFFQPPVTPHHPTSPFNLGIYHLSSLDMVAGAPAEENEDTGKNSGGNQNGITP